MTPLGPRNMLPRQLVTLTLLVLCAESVHIYSSFWAPLFDRSILNYRVVAAFDSEAAKAARGQYAKEYGYRGERLIADLGNGKGPGDLPRDLNMYGDVKFYYT